MPDSVEKRLETLPDLSRADLAQLWQKLFLSVPDPRIRRPSMIRFLAYRIQEQAYGSLSVMSERRLRQLSRCPISEPLRDRSPDHRYTLVGSALLRPQESAR